MYPIHTQEAMPCHTYGSSGVKSAGSRVNCGSKFDIRSVSSGSNVGIYGGMISFCASFSSQQNRSQIRVECDGFMENECG